MGGGWTHTDAILIFVSSIRLPHRPRPRIRHGRTRRHPRPLRTHVRRQERSRTPAARKASRTRGRTCRKESRWTRRTRTGAMPRVRVRGMRRTRKAWNAEKGVLTGRNGRCAMRGSDPTIDTMGQVMGLAAAASVVLAAGAAFATPVDVFDDRKAIDAGLLEIYEARDLDISVKGKEGGDRFAFKKSLPIDQVVARAKTAAARFDGEVLPAINKGYWTEARQAMRRAMGTLRYDINTLAEAKGVTKAAKVVTKDTFKKIDALDFAIRNKDKEAALDSFVAAKAAVDAEISSLV
uniref:Uncharacterized protein n=1 Tax=Picocystis salinarum TaxID=88271 RepID=A0A7S3UBT2_9CHLO